MERDEKLIMDIPHATSKMPFLPERIEVTEGMFGLPQQMRVLDGLASKG